jgi:nitroimidazol reductase NimA-like FMN-containing flavoprotein (pyridoxamine 5'-phosphate oxidase superfamily)
MVSPLTSRTRVRRLPDKQVADTGVRDAVLDAGLVAHVAVVDDAGQPFVIPTAYARDGERLLLHGSTGSRLFRMLANGSPTCLTVTLLDGMVLARSAFESSMRYRSVVVLGSCEVLEESAKEEALRLLSDHLLPGRWPEVRPPSRKELAQTLVLSLPLAEWSLKVSAGWPDDAPEDLSLDCWAGVVPLHESWGEPAPSPDLRDGIELPGYVKEWRR